MKQAKKSGFSKINTLLIVIFGILVVFGLGWYIQRLAMKRASVSTVLKHVESTIKNTYDDIAIDNAPWHAQMGNPQSVSVDGYDFKVSSDSAPTLIFVRNLVPEKRSIKRFGLFAHELVSAGNPNVLEPLITNTLHKYGFTKSGQNYTRGNDTCYFNSMDGISQLSCGSSTTFKAAAADAKPFVDEFLKANTAIHASELTFGPVTIKSKYGSGVFSASKTPGYDIAEAVAAEPVVGSSSGDTSKLLVLFVRKGSGDWQEVTIANDEFGFNCTDFRRTDDIRKALYDQICYEHEGDKGQIRLDTNNRALQ